MKMSKEEVEVYIDLYRDILEKMYEELSNIAEAISTTSIDINDGKAGYDMAKKTINKKFREANIIWDVVYFLEKTMKNLEEAAQTTQLDEYD